MYVYPYIIFTIVCSPYMCYLGCLLICLYCSVCILTPLLLLCLCCACVFFHYSLPASLLCVLFGETLTFTIQKPGLLNERFGAMSYITFLRCGWCLVFSLLSIFSFQRNALFIPHQLCFLFAWFVFRLDKYEQDRCHISFCYLLPLMYFVAIVVIFLFPPGMWPHWFCSLLLCCCMPSCFYVVCFQCCVFVNLLILIVSLS